jgi:Tol biopolymer transport system component
MRPDRWASLGLVALLSGALAGVGPTPAVSVAATRQQAVPSAAAHLTTPAAAASSGRRDGRLIFANVDTGQLETSNPDGTAREVVSPKGEVAIDAAWTRDGSRIAYSSNLGGNDFRVFVAHADGTARRQVTKDADGFSDFSPTFTRNGRTIIYTRCRPDPPGGCALFSVPAAGGARHAMTAFGDRADFEPDVAPGGRRIAFTRFGFRGIQAAVWVMRIDGTHAHRITTARFEAGAPRWTPDGRHLLVTNLFVHVGDNIVRIRDDGTHRRKLTDARFPHNAVFAAPSPSGRRIVFSDDRAYPKVIGADLVVMRRSGAGEHAITHDGRLLDADWGTAPLHSPSPSTGAFARGRPLTHRQVAALPSWVTRSHWR